MKNLIHLLIFFSLSVFSQSDVPLTLRTQFNGSYGYTIIGNTLNPFDSQQLPSLPCEMLSVSSAVLNLNVTQTIQAAYLYWSGIGDGTFNPIIQLNSTNLTADYIGVGNPEPFPAFACFGSFKDITTFVQNTGNGIYNFSGLDLNSISGPWCSTAEYYAGWAIIVVYIDSTLPNVQLNIYDGFNVASQFFNNSVTPLTISNLNVANTSNAKMSYLAYRGTSNNFSNEYITFNGNTLSNNQNPSNNPFNSTNSFTGSNTFWNMDIDTFDISPYINIGNTSANIIFASDYSRFLQTVITSIRSEFPDATVQLNQITGQEICGNRDLVVNYTVANTNSNAVLQTNVPVSFYADNTLLQTVNTPSSIAIGGSLNLQTTLTIPTTIPNTFDLKVVVDNNSSNASTIAESNENNNDNLQTITLADAVVNPTFNLQNSFCQNAIVPVLPSVSDNGISGSWLPNVIDNQNSGSYVFTPNAGQCTNSFTLNTTISSNVIPAFSLQNSFCQSANVPSLPSISDNGINGTWSPNVIDNQNDGSYVFTPNVGQCANFFTLNVTVSPFITPTFSLQNTFCQNAIIPILPTVSNNGISGTWSPNVIDNQNNGSYVFTPNIGSCGNTFTLNVTISQNENPTFNIQNSFCQGATVPSLPIISENGVSGTWLPNLIDNQNDESYVFTPNVGQCVNLFTLNISIQKQPIIIQNLSICKDENGNAIASIDLNSGLNQNGFTFVWTKNNVLINNNTASISVLDDGIYNLVASDISSGCRQNFEFNVSNLQPLKADYKISDDFELTQTIVVDAMGGEIPYLYSFDNLPFQNNAIFKVNDGGEILVKTKDNSGCYEISKMLTLWQFPRFFTPNGDGFNDTWSIKTNKKIRVDIFDRFGKLLSQLQKNEKWDGTFDSQLLPANDYWFVIYYENKMFKGHFALKR